MADIVYRSNIKITVSDFIDLLKRSTLAERRPIDDAARIQKMLDHANVIVTAWAGDQLLWSNDGNVRATTMTAPAANLGEGRNLAAAANERGTVVAFVSTTESKKSVWLEVAK